MWWIMWGLLLVVEDNEDNDDNDDNDGIKCWLIYLAAKHGYTGPSTLWSEVSWKGIICMKFQKQV